MSLKIYIADENKKVGLTRALKIVTDEWIDNGGAANQTVIDLRDACIVLLKENRQLKKGGPDSKARRLALSYFEPHFRYLIWDNSDAMHECENIDFAMEEVAKCSAEAYIKKHLRKEYGEALIDFIKTECVSAEELEDLKFIVDVDLSNCYK